MSDINRSDADRAREYLDLAHTGETSGSTDQGEGGPTAADASDPPDEEESTPDGAGE
jgi:hypothetical protein